MVNIFNTAKFNSVLLCGTLVAFSMTTISVPCHAAQGFNVNLNDVAFGIRIEKLVEKIIKLKDKGDSKRLIETMVEVKQAVEGYTGQNINLDKQLDQVENDMRKSGAKYSKTDMKKLRSILKKQDKKGAHKALCMELRMLDPDLQMSIQDEQMLYMAKHANDKDQKEDQNADLPLRLTIGVTVALCGLFLCFVPIPMCKAWGADLMKAGVALAVEGYVNRQEEDKDKDNKKK